MKLYPWLNHHFKNLIAYYQDKRCNHAILIKSLPGMGDDLLVNAVARFLICQQPREYINCGKCHGCQLMQAGTHPNYYILKPEKDKIALKISELQEVSKKLHKSINIGNSKVLWLTNTTFLTEKSINILFRMLEDSTNQTWFFISCNESDKLLTKLRNRCFLYYLNVPQESWSLVWLEQQIKSLFSKEEIITALRLCNGAPISALALLEPKMHSQRKYLCILVKLAIKNRDWLSLLKVLDQNMAPEYHLYWLISLLIDALKIQYGAKLIVNVDSKSLISLLAKCFSSKHLLAIFSDICYCREQLLVVKGINRELLLIDQLLRIESYLCM